MVKVGLCGLRPVADAPVQPYFTRVLQLSDILGWILSQTGPADVDVSTYSTSEGFIRRMAALRADGSIRSCRLLCDLRASRKTLNLLPFIASVFSDARLTSNHSKVILVHSPVLDVAVVTSQNQTRGDRHEAGVITSDAATFRGLSDSFNDVFNQALPIDGLL